jgi:hypothetical protein
MDGQLFCGTCEQLLCEGGRVYFKGVHYHEECFNQAKEKTESDRQREEEYFKARKGFYR